MPLECSYGIKTKRYVPAEKNLIVHVLVYTNVCTGVYWFIQPKQTGVMVPFKALFSILSNKYILKHNSLLMCIT